MRYAALMVSMCVCSLSPMWGNTQSRLRDATEVINEIMATPDKGIPQELFEKARC